MEGLSRRTLWKISARWTVLVVLLWFRVEADSIPTTPAPSVFEDCERVIGCECVDLGEVTGVNCGNVTDFALLTLHLRDGSLFVLNDTFEITITGVRSLPPRCLEGLIVFRLILDDPDLEEISERAFENVLRLRRLHVRQSAVQTIPNLRSVAHSLRNLNFDESRLSAVEGELRNLPLLEELTLRHNAIQTISEGALEACDNLRIVDFSYNLLETLPSNLLDALPRLMKLVLSNNRLLHVKGLLAIARPKFIFLDNNRLSEADDILHLNMTSVETLYLQHNPLGHLTETTFNLKVPDIRFLYLEHCQIREFDIRHFNTLSSLVNLDLSENLITKIQNQTIFFGLSFEQTINLMLADNQITSFEGEILPNVKRLYLNGNRLRLLGPTLQLTQLYEVELNGNQLEAILDSDFRGMHNTENLAFRSNGITRLETRAFVPIRNFLHNLDISLNSIRALNGSVRYLSQLKSLNASYNVLRTFDPGEFEGLNELSELYLQYNSILMLGGRMQTMPHLQYLVIQHNRISNIRVDQLPKSLKFLYLKDNPILCDCKLLRLLDWMSVSGSPQSEVVLCQPSNATHHDMWACPPPCNCTCVHNTNQSYVHADCSERNISETRDFFEQLPPGSGTSWSGGDGVKGHFSLVVAQNTDPRFAISDRLLSLNLENDSIASLESWRLPDDLGELNLAGNTLTTLPESVLSQSKLRRLTLSRNPWSCNCTAVPFKTWLLSRINGVMDVNQTRCGSGPDQRNELFGRLLTSLSDVDLCPSDIGLYISVAFGLLSFLLVCAAAKITYSRYELHIKVWLYSRGVSWVKEKDIDKDKIFDAFVSFSHKDDTFVIREIVSEIEAREPEIRLCLHYRHFLPGEFIQDNILNAVRYSKRTVLVLSRNFLESEWCLMEFRAAHLQALEDKVHRIIVVKVGDLPEDVDPAIKVYLDSTTYVTWGERHFWEKLLYALPTPGGHYASNSCTTPI